MKWMVLSLMGLSLLWAGNTPWYWQWDASLDGEWDNNIADNPTHQSELWLVPAISSDFAWKFSPSIKAKMSVDLRYENYLESRIATLNAPVDQYTLAMQFSPQKTIDLELGTRFARTVDSQWEPVKYLYRAFINADWKVHSFSPGISLRADWENYGDPAEDGNTYWVIPNLQWNLKKSFAQLPDNSALNLSYQLENRQSQSSAYTYAQQTWTAEISTQVINNLDLRFSGDWGLKDYATQKHNRIWGLSGNLRYAWGKMFSAKTQWTGENTHSSAPGYSWSEKTAKLSVHIKADSKK